VIAAASLNWSLAGLLPSSKGAAKVPSAVPIAAAPVPPDISNPAGEKKTPKPA